MSGHRVASAMIDLSVRCRQSVSLICGGRCISGRSGEPWRRCAHPPEQTSALGQGDHTAIRHLGTARDIHTLEAITRRRDRRQDLVGRRRHPAQVHRDKLAHVLQQVDQRLGPEPAVAGEREPLDAGAVGEFEELLVGERSAQGNKVEPPDKGSVGKGRRRP